MSRTRSETPGKVEEALLESDDVTTAEVADRIGVPFAAAWGSLVYLLVRGRVARVGTGGGARWFAASSIRKRRER